MHHLGEMIDRVLYFCFRDLPAHSNTIYVRIPQPKTNVNWYDFVKATPGEATKLNN